MESDQTYGTGRGCPPRRPARQIKAEAATDVVVDPRGSSYKRGMKSLFSSRWMGLALLTALCLPAAASTPPGTAIGGGEPEKLTVTVTATWKGDYSRNWSDKGTSVTETDHVQSTCSATLSRTAPAGTSLARMTNRNVDWTCTVSGRGSGAVTGKGTYRGSWEYKLKNPGKALGGWIVRTDDSIGRPGTFTVHTLGPPQIEASGKATPADQHDLGDAAFNMFAGLALLPMADKGMDGAAMEIQDVVPGHDAAFLSKLTGTYDVNARSVNKSGSASHTFTKASPKDGTTLTGVVEVKYALSYNGKSAVRILKPVDGTRRVFGLAADGSPDTDSSLTIAAEASVSSPELASQLVWTLEQVGSSKIEVQNQDGGKATITLKGLPQRNSDFGPKKLTARAGDAEDSVTVKLFYRRDARDNDGTGQAKEPNWFYYWKQTAAAQGHTDAIWYGAGKDPCKDGDIGRFQGYHDVGQAGGIYICDLSTKGFKACNPIIATCQEGIDLFAATVLHEWKHKTDYEQWWGPNGLHPGKAFDEAFDGDLDLIPDEVEPTLTPKANPRKFDSIWKGVGDEHYFAWAEEGKWRIGDANKKDWACPGKQCDAP
jgi:hypothetical protein